MFWAEIWKISEIFYLKIFIFLVAKCSVYLNRHVFVMGRALRPTGIKLLAILQRWNELVASSEKVPSKMRKMRRFRSSRECAAYHPGLCAPFIHSVEANDSVSGQRRPWLGCAFAVGLQSSHGMKANLRFMGLKWKRAEPPTVSHSLDEITITRLNPSCSGKTSSLVSKAPKHEAFQQWIWAATTIC